MAVEFFLNMQIKLFTVPITDSGSSIEEVNRFLRANKILEVEHQLVSNERGASWCFCVKYLPIASTYHKGEKIKIDYKTILSEEKFKVFSELRELRKQIAYKDAVPAYAVCTDQELAEIVQLPVINQATLKTVKGFGDKKLEKYGLAFIEWFQSRKG